MKRIILVIGIFLTILMPVAAQHEQLKQANDLYAKGKYTEAAHVYEQIISEKGVAPQLYYNLGNAYYKMNETGKSILNFERALRLDPGFDDARFNLEVAQQKVVDNIVQTPTFFVGRWIQLLMKLFSSNQWMFISFVLFLSGLGLAILFVFGKSMVLRKGAFYVGIAILIASMVALTFSGARKNQLVDHREAIVMIGVVTVKSSPDKSGTDLFQLHEGTKVSIKSTLGDWVEIELENGNVGWMEVTNVEKI